MSILKAQVMLVDGHAMMRQSIAILVNQESDMEVCAEAKDGCEAIEALKKNSNVDIVLLAMTFRTMSGFEIIKDINKQGVTILLVEQNALQALQISHRGLVLETGRLAMQGDSKDLLKSDEVRRAYLGEH